MLLTHLLVLAQAVAERPPEHLTVESGVKLGADLATIGALIFAAITMRLTGAQLRDSRASARVTRAAEFGSRWSQLEFVKIRTSLYALLRSNPSPDLKAIQTGMSNDPNMEAAMRLVLNFYEEMGVVFNHGEIDERLLRALFKSQIRFICDRAWPYIDFLQQNGQKSACEAMLKMNQNI